MKRYIITWFAFAAVVIGMIAAMMHCFFGAKGLIAYLIFAGLCLALPVRRAYRILKNDKELHNNT